MSFIFSRALAAEFSLDNCSDADAFVLSSANPTPKPSSSRGKTTARSPLSRFGMTCAPLTDGLGAESLMSWLAAFRARTSVLPVAAMASKVSAPGSGRKWLGSFARYDPAASRWKTAQCSLLGGSEEFLETWPRWGSMRNGESFLRPTWTPLIFGSESGSQPIYPAPVAIDAGSGRINKSLGPNAKERPTLALMAKRSLWPTPTVCGNYNRKGASATAGDGLATAVIKQFRTPNASDGAKWSNQSQAEREAKGQQVRLCHQLGVGGLLNPEWVEWLMGWPIGHTALEPLATDKYREWQQQHGPC